MAKAAYRIIGNGMSVQPQLNEAGTGIEDVHVIPYAIDSGPASGHKGHVKVPHSQFTTDNVRAAVEDDVNTHHDIASIKQG